MKIRVKFSKHGAMKFIGHLDILRYFQKAIRRAEIPIVFTEGFSPHMVMSFASPLGVGIESEGEYMDIEIREPLSTEEAVRRLDAVMSEGMRILDFRQIPDEKASNAMALVAAADYRIRFRDGYEPDLDWKKLYPSFLEQPAISIIKKTKKSETELDIRPLIYESRLEGDSIFVRLSSGSAANIKPELMMDAFAAYAGFSLEPFSLMITRLDLYAAGPNGGFVSLNELGEKIG